MHSSQQLRHDLVSIDDVVPISASDDVGDELVNRSAPSSPSSNAPNPLLAQLPWQAIDDVRPFSDPDPISESVSSSSVSSQSSAPIVAPRPPKSNRSNKMFADGQFGLASKPLAEQPSLRPTAFAPRDRADVLSSLAPTSAPPMSAPSWPQSANQAFNPLATKGPSSVIEKELRGNSSGMRTARHTGWCADGLSGMSMGASIAGAALTATGIGAAVGVPLMVGSRLASTAANSLKAGAELSMAKSITETPEYVYGDEEQQGVLQKLSDKHIEGSGSAAVNLVGGILGGVAPLVTGAASNAAKVKSLHDVDSDPGVRTYAANIQNRKQKRRPRERTPSKRAVASRPSTTRSQTRIRAGRAGGLVSARRAPGSWRHRRARWPAPASRG